MRCLGKLGATKASRLVLSLFFKAVLGICRVFHFETLDDPGFAILSGGRTVLGRNALGGLIRAAPVRGVKKLVRQTAPTVKTAVRQLFSIDEHAIARFTRKFDIRKGFHTIRNKHMKIEKLFFAYDLVGRKLLPVVVTRGHDKLAKIAKAMLPSLRRRARGADSWVILDAGAAHNHDELFDLADHGRQVTVVRAPRRPSYRKMWARIPNDQWQRFEEAGRYNKAPPKIIHVAEIQMQLRGKCRSSRSVRAIVVREQGRRGKERWHALWVFGDEHTPAYEIVQTFRQRQHHEQSYRVLLHDAYVDTAPSGYNKQSPNPKRPGFKTNALTLYT